MNTVIVEYYDWENDHIIESFQNVIGYNVANGMAQVILSDGVMRIINNFIVMDVIPDEDSRKRQQEMTDKAYAESEKDSDVVTEGNVVKLLPDPTE